MSHLTLKEEGPEYFLISLEDGGRMRSKLQTKDDIMSGTKIVPGHLSRVLSPLHSISQELNLRAVAAQR